MKAALVSSFESPPSYGDLADPVPSEGEVRIEVRAAALSQLVRSQASGKHYSSEARFPIVPGVDGVGLLDDGRRVYFAFPRTPFGAMAERTVVAPSFVVEVPDDVDDVTAAAIANPGMSSWAGLARASFARGQSVLVNGGTGTSGRLAIQIARYLGARRIVATGRTTRSVTPLTALGADEVIPLDQEPRDLVDVFRRQLANGIDVVLDYLWGAPALALLEAFVNRGTQRTRFVQIGSLAGTQVPVPASAFRSSGLELLGSGLGSVSRDKLVGMVGEVLNAVTAGGLTIATAVAPLSEVEKTWNEETPDRIVFTP